MTLADLLLLALRNLRQAKLRATLTATGVAVGVMAIVCMVSFGIGLQENLLARTLAKFDIFTTVPVTGASVSLMLELQQNAGAAAAPAEAPATGPSAESPRNAFRRPEPRRPLDDKAIAEIEAIAGVDYVLPRVTFSAFVQYDGKTRQLGLAGAPLNPAHLPGTGKLLAGQPFSNDYARELIVTENFTRLFARAASRRPPNSPFAPPGPELDEAERAKAASLLLGRDVVLLTLRAGASAEAVAAAGDPNPVDTRFERQVFRIVGVVPNLPAGAMFDRMIAGSSDLMVPMGQARLFRQVNSDPLSRLGAALLGDTGYPAAVVHVTDPAQTQRVYEEINKLGLRAFSLTNQLDEVKRVFLIIDASLALLGGIALFVAALGISNTLIMSITERTREIGIMKAIGGGDGQIMGIFFLEAVLIGLIGGLLGSAAGWAVDGIANHVVNRYVGSGGKPVVEFFFIPWYLWVGAVGFAAAISLLAAAYPAFRAARVDPIKALRHD
jgi:putative ABC transport system permease protein